MKRLFTLVLILVTLWVGFYLYFATKELLTTVNVELNAKDT